jgi:hypothetical protein
MSEKPAYPSFEDSLKLHKKLLKALFVAVLVSPVVLAATMHAAGMPEKIWFMTYVPSLVILLTLIPLFFFRASIQAEEKAGEAAYIKKMEKLLEDRTAGKGNVNIAEIFIMLAIMFGTVMAALSFFIVVNKETNAERLLDLSEQSDVFAGAKDYSATLPELIETSSKFAVYVPISDSGIRADGLICAETANGGFDLFRKKTYNGQSRVLAMNLPDHAADLAQSFCKDASEALQ